MMTVGEISDKRRYLWVVVALALLIAPLTAAPSEAAQPGQPAAAIDAATVPVTQTCPFNNICIVFALRESGDLLDS